MSSLLVSKLDLEAVQLMSPGQTTATQTSASRVVGKVHQNAGPATRGPRSVLRIQTAELARFVRIERCPPRGLPRREARPGLADASPLQLKLRAC